MKLHQNKFQNPALLLLLAAALWTSPVMAAPVAPPMTDQPAKTNSITAIRSVFIIPASPKEGCDPFFPESLRPFQVANATAAHSVELTSLVFRGVSGPPGHQLVIINNHTFSAGDEEDVITSSGRIHVRCVEIKASSVVIEAGGQRTELGFSTK
jgi:hypothetical protein